jgi:DNA-binding MarR family transcriptional regulator
MADSSPFDHNAIDEVIHGRIRLGIVAYLATVTTALFGELRDRVGTTDGNLSTHLRKLEEAGYVAVSKRFVARRPQTRIALTPAGRTAWLDWLGNIQKLAAAAGEPVTPPPTGAAPCPQ